jgi:C-terminal processing protease CtpA/Prc
MKIFKSLVIFCLLVASCGRPPTIVASPAVTIYPTQQIIPTPTSDITPAAAKYINEALDIMQNNSINKKMVEWPTFRALILSRAKNTQKPVDTYPFIKYALSELNDNHSRFVDPQQASESQAGSTTPEPPNVRLVENKFGYVLVPAYDGLNTDMINQYGTDMQKRIQEVDAQHPCGWIVDLRGNLGGNMWPMLIGIGPILGEGKAGSWVDADGNQSTWSYEAGKGFSNNEVVSSIINEPYYLAQPNPPVAVLFGGYTYSSGEIIVISFIGRTNTRSFGSKSGGLSSANELFQLSDGAMIVLTTSVDMDRTGKIYGGKIEPDVQVGFDNDNNFPGAVPNEGLQWLSEQTACKTTK